MREIIIAIGGLIIGTWIGFFICALLVTARRGDEQPKR